MPTSPGAAGRRSATAFLSRHWPGPPPGAAEPTCSLWLGLAAPLSPLDQAPLLCRAVSPSSAATWAPPSRGAAGLLSMRGLEGPGRAWGDGSWASGQWWGGGQWGRGTRAWNTGSLTSARPAPSNGPKAWRSCQGQLAAGAPLRWPWPKGTISTDWGGGGHSSRGRDRGREVGPCLWPPFFLSFFLARVDSSGGGGRNGLASGCPWVTAEPPPQARGLGAPGRAQTEQGGSGMLTGGRGGFKGGQGCPEDGLPQESRPVHPRDQSCDSAFIRSQHKKESKSHRETH